jgi:hypothetical protein
VVVTGEKSDAAVVVTTLIVASAFTPIKDRLGKLLSARFRDVPDNTRALRTFTQEISSYLEMSDAALLARRFLEEAAAAVQAEAGAVSLVIEGLQIVATSGRWRERLRSQSLQHDGPAAWVVAARSAPGWDSVRRGVRGVTKGGPAGRAGPTPGAFTTGEGPATVSAGQAGGANAADGAQANAMSRSPAVSAAVRWCFAGPLHATYEWGHAQSTFDGYQFHSSAMRRAASAHIFDSVSRRSA